MDDALLVNDPAEHGVHSEAPAEEKEPGEHSMHTEIFMAPTILE